MKVKDKIAQKRERVAVQVSKTYKAVCIKCKVAYTTEKELDLDGHGRCPPCQQIRNAEIEAMMKQFPPSPKERTPSIMEMPGIEFNGIKFYPLK